MGGEIRDDDSVPLVAPLSPVSCAWLHQEAQGSALLEHARPWSGCGTTAFNCFQADVWTDVWTKNFGFPAKNSEKSSSRWPGLACVRC